MFDGGEERSEDRGAHAGGVGDEGREADRQLRRIAKRRSGLDAEEARWLVVAKRAEVHRRFGFATFAEYVERRLGYAPKTCADRMRVAEALERLPVICAALAGGEVAYSTVRELVRVAVEETEGEWLEKARGKTVREVEEIVTGHQPGDGPEDPSDPDLRMRVLRIDLTPQTYAMFREVEEKLTREAGHRVSEDDVIAAMCRAVLVPTSDGVAHDAHVGRANRPHYQVAMTVCDECKRGWQDGGGQTVEVGPAAIATACCDAQVIGRIDRDDAGATTRATRTIPPATRRLVLHRDHRRCVVPGCRLSAWIDVHHVRPREHGGTHDLRNLVTLCNSHHHLLHDGRLAITGQPGSWQFWNGDGTPWGSIPGTPDDTTARTVPASAQNGRARTAPITVTNDAAAGAGHTATIGAALCKLGFRPAEAAAATAHAYAHAGANASLEALLRAALQACRRPT
jgi:hypothetical protein